MTAQAIQTPLPTFMGANGLPLAGGYVYFGEPYKDPRQFPVNVYFDEALTLPATLPLRTVAGYLRRNGAPANVWVDETYSVLVLDSNGQQVFYVPDWTGASSGNVTFQQNGTGAVAMAVQEAIRALGANFEQYGAVGDGVTDDTAAMVAALATGKRIVATRGKNYKITSTLTITDRMVDFGGATITYVGGKNAFAMVINASTAGFTDCLVEGFTLKCTDTDTTNRTHGLCLGGANGGVRNFKIEGFTGIELALGSGVESYTGVTLPSAGQCFYWDIENVTISSTAGWNLVIKASNNANRFSNFSTFAYNGFNTAPPRVANCINEVVIAGLSNVFSRTSLEASPSGAMVVFTATANANEFLGNTYLEYNTSWATPPSPRITAAAQSSGNRMSVRHPYGNVKCFSDAGTGNDFRAEPSFYVNGQQELTPKLSRNLVTNGDFENGLTNWGDFSTGGTFAVTTAGAVSGKRVRATLVAGRPSLLQNLETVAGIQVAGLVGQNITVGVWIKTNLPNIKPRIGGITGNGGTIGNETEEFITVTYAVPSGATTLPLSILSDADGTGYVEISNVTGYVGLEAGAVGERTVLTGSATYDPPSLAAGASQKTTVTVTGAVVGDKVTGISHSQDGFAGADDIVWTGKVTANNLATVWMKNNAAGAYDMPSGTLSLIVRKA